MTNIFFIAKSESNLIEFSGSGEIVDLGNMTSVFEDNEHSIFRLKVLFL